MNRIFQKQITTENRKKLYLFSTNDFRQFKIDRLTGLQLKHNITIISKSNQSQLRKTMNHFLLFFFHL